MYFWNTLYLSVACTGDIQKVALSSCESQNSQAPAPHQAKKQSMFIFHVKTYMYMHAIYSRLVSYKHRYSKLLDTAKFYEVSSKTLNN